MKMYFSVLFNNLRREQVHTSQWPFVNKIHFIAACLSGEWSYFKKSTKGELKFHFGFQAILKSNFRYSGISPERFNYILNKMETIDILTAWIPCCQFWLGPTPTQYLVNEDSFYAKFTNTAFQKILISNLIHTRKQKFFHYGVLYSSGLV